MNGSKNDNNPGQSKKDDNPGQSKKDDELIPGPRTTLLLVQPTAFEGNTRGCGPGLTEFKIENPGDGIFDNGQLRVSLDVRDTSSGEVFDFDVLSGSSTVGVDQVLVKGGPNYNQYLYNEATADDSLHAPVNPNNDRFYGLSHISFCYDLDARVTITKNSVPDSAQDFTFTSTGNLGIPTFVLDDDANPTQPSSRSFIVPAGSTGTVVEGVVPGWDLTNLVCTATGTGTSATTNLGTRTATITAGAGGNVTCTFTNTQRGEIRVVKNAVGGNATFSFTLTPLPTPSVSVVNSITTVAGTGSTNFPNLIPGNFALTESGLPPGWDLTNLVCADPSGGTTVNVGTRTATIGLAPGEVVTCTFTDTARGQVRIVKNSDAPGTFGFTGTGGIGNVSLTTAGTPPTAATTIINLVPGTLTLTESSLPPGFRLSDLVCADPSGGTTVNVGTRTATIDLAPGELVTCTYTNVRVVLPGSIKIVKDLVPNNDPGRFQFRVDGGALVQTQQGSTEFGDVDFGIVTPLTPGNFTVTETAAAGTDLRDYVTQITCVRTDTNAVVVNATVGGDTSRAATVPVFENVETACVYTNTRRGEIRIVKNTVPDGPQDFAFSGSLGNFSLDDDADGTLPNNRLFTRLAPGTFTVTEAAVAGFDLTNLVCVDPSGGTTTNLGTRTATIDLAPGELVTCTYTNTERGEIRIVKRSVGGNETFTFTGTPGITPSPFTITTTGATATAPGTGNRAFTNLVPGTFTFTESALPPGWDFTSLACVDPSGGTTVNQTTRTATIGLAPGELVTCTFTDTARGRIEIVKRSDAPGTFGFTGSTGIGNFDLITTAPSLTANRNIANLVPGTFTVTESSLPGFRLADLVCVDPSGGTTTNLGNRTATIDLAPGELVTCTYTNVRVVLPGSIKIVKDLVPNNDPGRFQFRVDGGALVQTQQGSTEFGDADFGIVTPLTPGNFTVTETAAAGTNLLDYITQITCVRTDTNAVVVNTTVGTGTSRAATVPVFENVETACVYTNTRRGQIRIVKNSNAPGTFGFTGSTGIGNFDLITTANSLTDDELFTRLAPGTFTVTESSLPSTFRLADLVCVDPSGGTTVNVGTRTATIDLAPGELVTCTYTNVRVEEFGRLEIIKRVSPSNDPGNFNIFVGAASNIVLQHRNQPLSATAPITVNTGNILVGELGVLGTVLSNYVTDVVCTRGSDVVATATFPAGSTASRQLNVPVGNNEFVTCLITNTNPAQPPRGTLEIIKRVSPSNDPGNFNLFVGAASNVVLQHRNQPLSATFGIPVDPGTYLVGELGVSGTVLSNYVTDVVCTRGSDVVASATFAAGSTAARQLNVPVGSLQDVTCLFTNTRPTGTASTQSTEPLTAEETQALLDAALALIADQEEEKENLLFVA